MAKLKLDLHDIFNQGASINAALHNIIHKAHEKKIPLIEIIPGKGTGALKERVLKFLQRKEIKSQYHRLEKDAKNFGRLFLHLRF